MPTNEPSPWDENIGKRVKLRRLQLGLSQESLGLALGVTFEQVQKYETGNDRIEVARLQQIAEILNVPILFFFGGTLSGARARQGPCDVVDFLDTAYALRCRARKPACSRAADADASGPVAAAPRCQARRSTSRSGSARASARCASRRYSAGDAP